MSTVTNIIEESAHTPKIGDKAVVNGNGSMVDKGKLYTTKSQGMPATTGTGKRARTMPSGNQGHS